MTPSRVFDGERLRATLWPGRSDRLVVTFDWRRPGRHGWGAEEHSTGFARQGFHQLAVRTRANDWFLNDETAALEAALARAARGFARVQMLGYSMGGYGALRFAAAIGAAQAVVVSPQVGLDAPWEGRYPEAAGWDAAVGDLGPRGSARLAGLLAFDPFVAPDLLHARAVLALFPRLRPVRLAFGGHPAIRSLRGAGAWRVVHEEAGRRGARAAAVAAAHRAARAGSPGWWMRMAAQAEARRPALAALARARAAALGERAGDWPEGGPES